MAKTSKGKVGSGLPGFSSSKGSSNRIWSGGEFLLEIEEVTAAKKENDNGDEIGQNIRVNTTCLGGPEQEDGTEPKGKKINIFMNVNYDLPFTIDQVRDLFNAAGVKTSGDEPPYAKLAGKTVVAKLSEKMDSGGTPRQRCYWVLPGKSKAFAGKASADDDD